MRARPSPTSTNSSRPPYPFTDRSLSERRECLAGGGGELGGNVGLREQLSVDDRGGLPLLLCGKGAARGEERETSRPRLGREIGRGHEVLRRPRLVTP